MASDQNYFFSLSDVSVETSNFEGIYSSNIVIHLDLKLAITISPDLYFITRQYRLKRKNNHIDDCPGLSGGTNGRAVGGFLNAPTLEVLVSV